VTAEEVTAESRKLTDYLNAEFEEELAMNPMMLTQMGRKELYDQLGDFSEADTLKQLEWRRQSVADMAELLGVEPAVIDTMPFALIGTPSQIADDLIERRDRYGFSFVTVSASELDAFAPVVAQLAGT
jgi:alkanesulfonate monooxygenase SsuD/methylene tetrahydromethanopterin reductase-like flavin-dependent oxidoreductase (luciferase family)